MSDIVERLRDSDTTRRTGESYADVHERRQADRDEAADEITRLTAENEKLRAELHEAADELDAYYRAEYCGDHPYSKRKLAEAMRDNPARAAIMPPEPPNATS